MTIMEPTNVKDSKLTFTNCFQLLLVNTSAKAVERGSEKIWVKDKGFFYVLEKGGGFGGEEVQL